MSLKMRKTKRAIRREKKPVEKTRERSEEEGEMLITPLRELGKRNKKENK